MTRPTHEDEPHYVYRCFQADGGLLYVGCTWNLAGRLTHHRSASFWSPLVVKVRATVHPDKATARQVEREAIRGEAPRFNIVGREGGWMNWSEQEWDDYILALGHVPGHPDYARQRVARATQRREAVTRLRAAFSTESAA